MLLLNAGSKLKTHKKNRFKEVGSNYWMILPNA
jgi:hypothetical protein